MTDARHHPVQSRAGDVPSALFSGTGRGWTLNRVLQAATESGKTFWWARLQRLAHAAFIQRAPARSGSSRGQRRSAIGRRMAAPKSCRPVSSTGQRSRTWVGPMSTLVVRLAPCPSFAPLKRADCRARAGLDAHPDRGRTSAANRWPPTAPRGARCRCDRRELLERARWHFDMDVAAIEQRAGEPAAQRGNG